MSGPQVYRNLVQQPRKETDPEPFQLCKTWISLACFSMILLNWKEWKKRFFLFIQCPSSSLLFSTSSHHQHCILILLLLCSVLFLPFYYHMWQYFERMDGRDISADIKHIAIPPFTSGSILHVMLALHHATPQDTGSDIITRKTKPVRCWHMTQRQKPLSCLRRLLSTTLLISSCSDYHCALPDGPWGEYMKMPVQCYLPNYL